MKIFSLILIVISISIFAQKNNKYDTFFEKGNGNQSATYQETISFYKTFFDKKRIKKGACRFDILHDTKKLNCNPV